MQLHSRMCTNERCVFINVCQFTRIQACSDTTTTLASASSMRNGMVSARMRTNEKPERPVVMVPAQALPMRSSESSSES